MRRFFLFAFFFFFFFFFFLLFLQDFGLWRYVQHCKSDPLTTIDSCMRKFKVFSPTISNAKNDHFTKTGSG
eukprot:COSAG06_NODE_4774_length_3962_cov_223.056951_1_plen_71_part_00